MTQYQRNGSLILPTEAPEDKNAFLNFSGKEVRISWDDDEYIVLMYEMWLQAVQQEKSQKETGKAYTVYGTFEEWLKDALQTLDMRRKELRAQMNMDDLDLNTYNNAKMTADLAEEAIKKFLEKPPTKRLIGV